MSPFQPVSTLLPSYTVVFVVFAVWITYVKLQQRRDRYDTNPKCLPTPPGPNPLPLLGNIFDIPRDKEAATYFKLAQQFGDLVFMKVLGKNILIVNTFKAANDLFDKRSSNYSDRSTLPMINDLMGWDWSFGHMPYGERWKTHRRMFQRRFQPSVAPVYWPVQLKEAHKLIRRILYEPNDLTNHLRHNAASTIMKVIYGIEVADHDDHYIEVAETALDGMAKAAHPGAFLVDIFPTLKYVPDWMPFARFKRQAKEWKKSVLAMRDSPFETVKQAFDDGKASPSFVSHLMEDLFLEGNTPDQLEIIRNCAGLAYAAGAESTVSALSSFFLAMILYPEVQQKAQLEIDRVVGRGRLPDFGDRATLPYIQAIVHEVLRWNPVAPLGLPHMVTHDDEYNGYHIPAGTLILGNSWTILHDPNTYQEPEKFNPDRFLLTKSGDSAPLTHLNVAFGYGRRICPGRYMAEAQIWISIACILSAFEISAGLDELGRPIKTEAAFSSGMICHPLPFRYTIVPRGDYAKSLVEQTADL